MTKPFPSQLTLAKVKAVLDTANDSSNDSVTITNEFALKFSNVLDKYVFLIAQDNVVRLMHTPQLSGTGYFYDNAGNIMGVAPRYMCPECQEYFLSGEKCSAITELDKIKYGK